MADKSDVCVDRQLLELDDLKKSFNELKMNVEKNLADCKIVIQAVAKATQDVAMQGSSSPPAERFVPLHSTQHSGRVVELNVGGQYFTTTLDTLTQQPDSMLAVMFSGRHPIAVDPSGRAFIDRDSELFRHVLAFLREGACWHPPADPVLWARLEREFEYFNIITGLEECEEAEKEEEPVATTRLPAERIFLLGGAQGGRFERYTWIVNRWEAATTPSTQFTSYMSAAALNGKMYVCGGRTPGGRTLQCEVYDPDNYRWQTAAPMISAREGHAAVACQGHLYALGGKVARQYLNSVSRYDPGSDSWMELVTMTSPRDGLAAVELDGVVYALGGKESYSMFLQSFERYDPREGQWQRLAPMQHPREGHAAASWLGRVFAVGGSTTNGILRDVESYDPVADRWGPEAPMSVERFGHSVAVVGGQLLALGGAGGNGDVLDMEVLLPPYAAGADLPPLPEWWHRNQRPANLSRPLFWGTAVAL